MSSDNAPKKRVVVHTSEDNPPEKKAKVIKDVNDTSPASASEKIVKWGVEDPSEFRPGMLENLGKDQENFRAFYDVRKKKTGLVLKLLRLLSSKLEDSYDSRKKKIESGIYQSSIMAYII